MVLIEKVMERLIGTHCYPCYVAPSNTRTPGNGRTPGWLDLLHKKRFQYCMNSDGFILYMRALQGHSGGAKVDLSLQDDAKIPYKSSLYRYRVGASLDLHSTFQPGLIAG